MLSRYSSLIAAACLWNGSAIAQSVAPPLGCEPASIASPRTRAEEIDSLYRRFECHFSRQEYVACLPFLERACLLTDSPRCLLNLGAVHHALMHCQLARGYYEQYLERSPYDEEVDAVRRALEELSVACPRSAGSAAPGEPDGPSAGEPEQRRVAAVSALAGGSDAIVTGNDEKVEPGAPTKARLDTGVAEARRTPVLAWSLLGAGAAGLTATLVAAGYGVRAERAFEGRAHANGGLSPSEDPELRAIDQRGRHYNNLALAFGTASGLLLAAGATVWILDVAPDASLTLSSDGSPGVSYETRF